MSLSRSWGRGVCKRSVDRRATNGLDLSPQDRFWMKVARRGAAECWPYLGAKGRRYGLVRISGRSMSASRAAWLLTNGPIATGLVVCHRCDNPPCCNPAHLFLGTMADNQRDMARKGRAARPRAKLTEDSVREIVAARRAGMFHREIAEAFGVDRATVSDILRGATWASVTGIVR